MTALSTSTSTLSPQQVAAIIADQKAANGAALRKFAEETPGETARGSQDSHALYGSPTSEPEPLRRPLPPAEPYPIAALGSILGSAAQRLTDVLRVPQAMAGQSVLAAASLAVQPHADVEIDGRRELLSLWAVTIGLSGERKSACDFLALRSHREFEREALKKYTEARLDFDLDSKAYEIASRTTAKGEVTQEIRDRLEGLGDPPKAPLRPLLLISSPTIEAIHKQLIDGTPSVGLFHDDAGEFLGGFSMGRDHRTKTAASLSKLWDSGEFDRLRAGETSGKHFGKRLALHLMMQPVIAEGVLSDDILTGQGFLARCLLSWPQTTIGTREYVETDLSIDASMLTYWRRVGEFLAASPSLRPETRNELEPRPLRLSAEGKRRWVDVHNSIETDMADSGDYAGVRGWASKAPAQVLRIAAILTLIEKPDAGDIGTEAIDRAASLVNHYLSEAARVVGTHSVPKSIRDAEALLAWCHHDKVEQLYSALALQRGPSCVRSKDHFDDAIEQLERCGWAIKLPEGMAIHGKPRRRAWMVRTS